MNTREILRNHPWNYTLVQEESQTPTILFVGPITHHHNQLELVRMAAILKIILDYPFQLILIGEHNSTDSYMTIINEEIMKYDLDSYVQIIRKVSDEELYAWYRSADVYVCLSSQEESCLSVNEAMVFNVPIIALYNTTVSDILGEAGILVRHNNPAAIATLVKLVLKNRTLRRKIIPPQKKSKQLRYQIEGSFETSYSLDIVNREIALALEKYAPCQVGIYATGGYGDYIPDEQIVRQHPGVEALWHKGCKDSEADVVIRNVYPPRMTDMNNPINFLHFFWEESGLPFTWVNNFNRKLDGMPTPTHYVAKLLRDNGIAIPIAVIGEGADHIAHIERQSFNGNLGQGFKFLHISSCFPRKGVDILLESYARTFTTNDPVSLIIKTFPNPHNTVEQQITDLRRRYPACPPIILINQDLPPGQIKDLYMQCDALVAPTRGEGFGLPMAEAMWLGKPVITTAYGGQSDFCTPETAWLIDFNFELADTHFGLTNSVWVAPKIDSLITQLRDLYLADETSRLAKIKAGQELIQKYFTWNECAQKIGNFEEYVKSFPAYSIAPKKLAWVSPWNIKCGIASYSSLLIDELDPMDFEITVLASRSDLITKEDTPNVKRCWQDCSRDISELIKELEEAHPDIIMIQYNFGFFSFEQLAAIIEKFATRDIPIFVTLHRTKDFSAQLSLGNIRNILKMASRLLVHGVDDLNRLKEWGLIENGTLISHGIKQQLDTDKTLARSNTNLPENDIIVASYGFLFPHKGIEELLLAFPHIIAKIPNARLLLVNALYPNGASDEIYQRCKKLIQNSKWADRITMINDYLEDEESMSLLACADLCVFAYQETAESSSAAARYGLSSHRPVACTPLSIFDDIKATVHFLPGIKPAEIAEGIINLLSNKQQLESKNEIQTNWINTNSWGKVAHRLFGMMKGISQGNNT